MAAKVKRQQVEGERYIRVTVPGQPGHWHEFADSPGHGPGMNEVSARTLTDWNKVHGLAVAAFQAMNKGRKPTRSDSIGTLVSDKPGHLTAFGAKVLQAVKSNKRPADLFDPAKVKPARKPATPRKVLKNLAENGHTRTARTLAAAELAATEPTA